MPSEKTQVAIDLPTTAFAAPLAIVGGALDDAGDIQNPIAPGGVTDDRQPGFHGQGTPGDTIVIRDNGNEIGTTEVADDGTWTFTPSTDLLQGLHAITVAALDTNGNESAPSPAFNFEIDVTPPDASRLNVSGFTDNVGGVTGNVISGGTTDETRPLLSGISNGTPGHTVTVMVKDATGTHELGLAIIGENGQWTFQVDTPLAAGLNTFMLVERDAAGNETMPTGRYKVTVNTDKPNAPVIDSVFDDVGEPHMLQQGEATNDARPTLAGTAPANHTVKFYDGSTYLGKAVADESGKWRFTPQIDLPDGAYNITATSTSPVGQTSDASSAWNFVVDTTPPTQTGTVTDIGKDSGFDADDYLTNDGSAGRLLQGKLSATLGAGETLQVSTDGGTTWTTAFVAGDQWSAQDGNSHTGDWTVQTRVVDAAGNLGPVESQAMAMDDAAPAVPTKVVATDGGIEVQFNPAGVAVGHKLSLILRGDHFDYALTAADIATGKVLVPGFKSSDAAGLSVAISDAAGNVSPYISPPFQGKETLDNLPKISVGESHTTSTGVGIEMVAGYVEPFDATHLYLSAQGIVSLKVPHPAKFVEIEYGNTHAAPYGKVEFYSEAGVLLGTKNMLSSPSSPNPMLKVGLSSEVPIAYIKVYCLDSGTAPGVNDAILLGDLMWTGGGQSSSSAQHQTLTDASAGTLHGGSDNNVFTVTDVKHMADSAISGNGGLDTLKLTGANQVLDLTALGHKVSSVEVIDITGTGNNKLSLSLADVMENGTKDLFLANGRVQMMVKGNAGDAVWLSDLLPNGTDPGDWTQGANVTIDGVVYEVYQHSGFKADLLVQQGVTVGLQISIDRVMDDAGPTTGEIDKGGLTDDATPTLYGKASANGIVKIYDGSTQLGQTVADAKGNWSYTPDTPLSEGPHSLSATVTTAGNAESAKTAVFELTVDTFTPTQTATVTEIGKDSGLSASDFLTNDGSAGRLMQGTLSAALASGETLRVSTDGGKTWKAAFVEGNKWSAQDDNSHSGDWTVQTRVVNEAGSIGTVQSQAVVLDTVAPKAPLSFKAVGTSVEVSFDKSDVVAGDRILVNQAGKSFSYALMAADVAAGKATFAPGFTAGSSASIGLIDAAGNASLSLRNTSGNKIEFSSPTGSHASWDGKDIGPISVLFDMPGYSYWSPNNEGRDTLYVYGSRVIKLGMPSGTSDFSITFKYSDGGWYTGQYITAHAANGAVLGKLPLPEKNTTAWQTFDFSTFGGEEIAYIELYTGEGGDSGFYLDKLSWNQSPNAAPSENQTLANGEAKHMIGGSGDTTFNIQNASDLDKSTVSGNEGLDTLKLTGANQTLDLTALAGKVSSVEIIDLTGTGNNTLKLSLADVMNNGAINQFVADGRVQMMVKGNAGDAVTLSDVLPNGTDPGDWVKKANVTVGGVVYEVYQHSGFDAELLVQQGVTVTLQNTTDAEAPNAPSIEVASDGAGTVQGPLADGAKTDDPSPTLSGKAEPGSTLTVYDGTTQLGTAVADADGNWRYTPTAPLSEGEHRFTATATDKRGNVSVLSGEFVLTTDYTAPLASTAMLSGNAGQIFHGDTIDNGTPTYAGQTESNATVVIYDNGSEIIRVQADAAGNWAFTPGSALIDGAHSFSHAVIDVAGNTGARGQATDFTVGSQPLPVSIDTATDNAGAISGAIGKGGVTDDTTPTLRGKATVGGTVKIYDGSTLLGSVVADASGNWTFTPDTPLSEGRHSLAATVTPVGGSESPRTAMFDLTVDLSAPAQPVIVSVADDQGLMTGRLVNGAMTDDTRPAFRGKAETNSTVVIYDNGVEIGRVQANTAGNWSFTPGMPLSEGAHSITLAAMDKVGNVSMSSQAFGFTVDTTVPLTVATIASVGKDSGVSATDFLTNDGSAGRLMQGTLSTLLAKGETLQVSTDGGQTWKAAFVEGNKWSAQDDNSHSSDWTVQTRVVNEAGSIGTVQSQAVVLDTVAPKAPLSFKAVGTSVEVSFDKSDVVAGDRILVNQAGKSFSYALTAADVAAGKATFAPGFTAGSSASIGLIDAAGNASLSLRNTSGNKIEFSSPTGSHASWDGKDIGPISVLFDMPGYSYWSPNNEGRDTLYVYDSRVIKLGMPSGTSDFSITFKYSDGGWYTGQYITAHAANGAVLGKLPLPEKNTTAWQTFDFSTFGGEEIAYIELYTGEGGDSGFYLDKLSWNQSPNAAPSENQTLANGEAKHMIGGSGDTTFNIQNASDLDKSTVSGNEGLDTLKLTGANQTLDLTALAGKVSSVEVIDLTGTGNNTLKLSLADVMNNGAINQFVADGRVQMMVKGNAGDAVTLSDVLPNGTDPGDWLKKANVMVGGVVYEVYQHSGFDAELLVQQGVTVTLQNAGTGTFHIEPEVEAYVLDHATQAYTDSDDTLIARLGFADRLEGGAGNDIFTKVGTGDTVHGGAGDDTIRINSGDFERVEGGLGIDTLVMDGKAMHIDLSALGAKVQGFEKFDLGAGGNTLALHASDVLAGGMRDMVTPDGKVQMLVNGANGDVNLLGGDDGWTLGNAATVGGVTYSVYTNLAGTAELLVEDKVHVTIL